MEKRVEERQKIVLLGSTGSIGEQTLDVVRQHADRFEVRTLTSNNNWQRLVEQALEVEPDSVVIANREHYPKVKEALAAVPVKVYAGAESLEQVARSAEADVVVNALVGYAGLAPTVSALKAGRKIALANKESLVVAGELIMRTALEKRVPIVPIDSEHSAIFQCLVGEQTPYRRIVLTASGGPFLDTPAEELERVTVEQALRHPNWKMGAKITIDSATMMNKGFEVIEARWLFGARPSQIEVLVHPQSVVHSMVEFADGAVKAQLGTPDMRLPIQYALTFPQRWSLEGERLDLARCGELTFRAADPVKFPNLRLAYEALERGGNSCCVLNAANEVAVASFLGRRIGFLQITEVLERTLARVAFVREPGLDDLGASDAEARRVACEAAEEMKSKRQII